MAAKRKVFTVRLERDEDGVWCGSVKLSKASVAYSDGPTLPKARRRIRQAVALGLDVDENAFDLREELGLPRRAMTMIRRHEDARERLRRSEVEAAEAARSAARTLVELGVSRRDAGDLLGLSGARVQQVLGS